MWVQAYKQLVNTFSNYDYIRHFWDRDLAGMVDWHQSRANLVVTSGQGTLNLWGLGAKHCLKLVI